MPTKVTPTPADVAAARTLIDAWLKGRSIAYTAQHGAPTWNDLDWLAQDIATALAQRGAEERARGSAYAVAAEWPELPPAAFPMTEARYKLALSNSILTIAAALGRGA